VGNSKETAPLSVAAESLRETTKWFVGGVVITAAAVFAGSSLTALGTLDIDHDRNRLLLALAGAIVGFVALGWITHEAIGVLTLESFTLRILANASHQEDPRLHEVAEGAWNKFRHCAPIEAGSLKDYIDAVDALPAGHPSLDEVRAFSALIMPDAAFTYVRGRFKELTSILIPATALAVIGFGLFAWAANPPTKSPPASGIEVADG